MQLWKKCKKGDAQCDVYLQFSAASAASPEKKKIKGEKKIKKKSDTRHRIYSLQATSRARKRKSASLRFVKIDSRRIRAISHRCEEFRNNPRKCEKTLAQLSLSPHFTSLLPLPLLLSLSLSLSFLVVPLRASRRRSKASSSSSRDSGPKKAPTCTPPSLLCSLAPPKLPVSRCLERKKTNAQASSHPATHTVRRLIVAIACKAKSVRQRGLITSG